MSHAASCASQRRTNCCSTPISVGFRCSQKSYQRWWLRSRSRAAFGAARGRRRVARGRYGRSARRTAGRRRISRTIPCIPCLAIPTATSGLSGFGFSLIGHCCSATAGASVAFFRCTRNFFLAHSPAKRCHYTTSEASSPGDCAINWDYFPYQGVVVAVKT